MKRSNHRSIKWARVVLVLIVVCSVWDAAARHDGEQIVVSWEQGGDRALYLMEPDGSGLTKLTFLVGREIDPAWSPDGSKIAFAWAPPNSQEFDIMVIDRDGRHLRNLTDMPGYEGAPTWSPDGERIAYNWDDHGIGVIGADGGAPEILLNNEPYLYPAWSPNGEEMLVVRWNRFGGLCRVRLDNGTVTVVTPPEFVGCNNPSWSPDGRRIAFVYYEDDRDRLYVINADGSNLTRIVTGTKADLLPSWSPAGDRILFTALLDDGNALFTVRPDGSELTQLTDAGGRTSADWFGYGLAVESAFRRHVAWGSLKDAR